MTKREIKTIHRQFENGISYEMALRLLIKLSSPDISPKDLNSITNSILTFNTLLHPQHQKF